MQKEGDCVAVESTVDNVAQVGAKSFSPPKTRMPQGIERYFPSYYSPTEVLTNWYPMERPAPSWELVACNSEGINMLTAASISGEATVNKTRVQFSTTINRRGKSRHDKENSHCDPHQQ